MAVGSLILDHHGQPLASLASNIDYEGASISRRMGDWGLGNAGPTAAIYSSLTNLRSRTRALIRNNPVIAGGVDSLASNLVGTDISPHWQLDNPKEKRTLQDLWADSQAEIDYHERYDFYGLLEQIVRGLCDAGEVLARFRFLPVNGQRRVPLQIQLLETDHLPVNYFATAQNGNEIRMGIEWTPEGKRAAYWLTTEHPGEGYAGQPSTGQMVRVPADEILHIFRPLRIGQARGCPWFGPALSKIYELDQFDDATLVRKKIANLFAVFFTSERDGNTITHPALPGGRGLGRDANNTPVVGLEPGLSARLRPGESVTVADPADVGDNYLDFVRYNLRSIARGVGLTYEQLTGDLSQVNFSSIRAGLIEIRRSMEMIQQRVLIHQFCRPVIRRWLDQAVLAGAFAISPQKYQKNRLKYYQIKWQPDGWEYVDPVKDRLAEQMDIRNGIDSRTAVIGRRGRDAQRVEDEIAAENLRADQRGLIFDSDPRLQTTSGQARNLTPPTTSP